MKKQITKVLKKAPKPAEPQRTAIIWTLPLATDAMIAHAIAQHAVMPKGKGNFTPEDIPFGPAVEKKPEQTTPKFDADALRVTPDMIKHCTRPQVVPKDSQKAMSANGLFKSRYPRVDKRPKWQTKPEVLAFLKKYALGDERLTLDEDRWNAETLSKVLIRWKGLEKENTDYAAANLLGLSFPVIRELLMVKGLHSTLLHLLDKQIPKSGDKKAEQGRIALKELRHLTTFDMPIQPIIWEDARKYYITKREEIEIRLIYLEMHPLVVKELVEEYYKKAHKK